MTLCPVCDGNGVCHIPGGTRTCEKCNGLGGWPMPDIPRRTPPNAAAQHPPAANQEDDVLERFGALDLERYMRSIAQELLDEKETISPMAIAGLLGAGAQAVERLNALAALLLEAERRSHGLSLLAQEARERLTNIRQKGA